MIRFLLVVSLLVSLLVALPGHTAAQADRITVEFWHTYPETGPADLLWRDTLIPQFEAADPTLHVQPVAFPATDFERTLLHALAHGTGPDIVRIPVQWLPQIADLGYLQPLDATLPDLAGITAVLYPGLLAAATYRGELYGLPLEASTRVLVWNRGMFAVAGLGAPAATFGDLLLQCAAILELEDEHYLFGDNGLGGETVLPWLWSFGAAITDPDLTRATGYLNSPTTVAAYTVLAEMAAADCFGPALLDVNEDAQASFFNSVTAATLGDPGIFSAADAQPLYINLDTAPMPARSGGSVTLAGGYALVIVAESDVLPAALDFLRFSQRDTVQIALAESGFLPVKPSLAENEAIQALPNIAPFLAALTTARPLPQHPAWPQIDKILMDVGENILSGEADPQTTLDLAAAEIDLILAEYH